MAKKFSKNFYRDVKFYLKNRNKFKFFGDILPIIEYDKNGIDGIKCYWFIDSNGEYKPTRHIRIVKAILSAKKSINFHIKMWADGFNDICEPVKFYMKDFVDPPEWVEKALIKAINKKRKK